jgi:hypothetical protein
MAIRTVTAPPAPVTGWPIEQLIRPDGGKHFSPLPALITSAKIRTVKGSRAVSLTMVGVPIGKQTAAHGVGHEFLLFIDGKDGPLTGPNYERLAALLHTCAPGAMWDDEHEQGLAHCLVGSVIALTPGEWQGRVTIERTAPVTRADVMEAAATLPDYATAQAAREAAQATWSRVLGTGVWPTTAPDDRPVPPPAPAGSFNDDDVPF